MYLGAPIMANGVAQARTSIFLPRALPLPKSPVSPANPPIPQYPSGSDLVRSGVFTWPVISPANPPTPHYPPTPATPVPAGFPTNQMFVAPDGSFWQFSTSNNQWVNVGTPYNTGAAATPPATPPSSTGANTTPPATTAPAPVAASASPSIVTSSYQEILDWLNQDSLLATIGFAGIPNWITGAGVALIVYKVSNKSGRR
jgi:hypothetical protein